MKRIVLGVLAFVGLTAFADGLPGGYEAVEFVASDGAQYVDTGVVGQEGLTASVDFMYTRDTSRCILGASEGGVTLTLPTPEHAAVKMRYQVETAFGEGAGSLYLFACNDAGSAANCAFARIYGAKLRVGETVLRDYVPCREVASGTYGLYELKEGAFRPSQGARPFFRPWRVGVFTGRGATGAVMSWCQLIDRSPWLDLTILSPTLAQKSATFDSLDAVVFPGGTAGTQYSSLGASGRTNVRNFVRNGGCYYGTCAGFHLVLNDMLDMSGYRYLCSADRHERVNVRLTDDCKAALGLTQEVWSLGYSAGPLSTAGTAVEGANLTVWGKYETDIVGPNDVQMNGKPAVLAGTYFDGRMFVTASHPEFYSDTTPLITRGFRWLSGRDDIVVDDYGDDYVEGRMNVFLDTTYSGISSLAATVLKVNNDPRMNLVKGATSTYVDSSTYKANGRVALYPTGVLGTEASGSSASKTAIAAFKRCGGLCLYEDDGFSGDDVWALVDAVERDTRTEKSLAWGAGNALAFTGDRTITGQDLRISADGEYVTTFADGDVVFAANADGLGGDWAYCADAVAHRIVIDNARVKAVYGNHRRDSQMTATDEGVYSPVAKQAFEITLGDRNAAEGAAALTFVKGAMIASGSTLDVDARGKSPGTYKLIEAKGLVVRGATSVPSGSVQVDEGLFATLGRDKSGNAIVLEITESAGDLYRVDWVASTGTQYIDTEIDMQDKLTFEADCEWLALKATSSATYSVLFGAYASSTLTGGSTYRYYFGYVKADTGAYRTGIETGSLKDVAGLSAAVGTRFRFAQSVNGKVVTTKIDGGDAVTTTYTAAQKAHPYSCYLFAHRSNSGVAGQAKVRLYGAKIYTNETVLARDYVPCYRAETGRYGLFDRVTQTFQTSLSGDFDGAVIMPNPERLGPPVPMPTGGETWYKVGQDAYNSTPSFAKSASATIGWAETEGGKVDATHVVRPEIAYVIPSSARLRTPMSGATHTFLGKTLTLAGSFLMNTSGTDARTLNLPPVKISSTSALLSIGNPRAEWTVTGSIDIPAETKLTLGLYAESSTTGVRYGEVMSAALSGAGTLAIEGSSSYAPKYSYLTIADAAAFTGQLQSNVGAKDMHFSLYVTGGFGGSVLSLPIGTTNVVFNYDGLDAAKGLPVATSAVPDALLTHLTFYSETADFSAEKLPLLTFPAGTEVDVNGFTVRHATAKDGAATPFKTLAVVTNADGAVQLVANCCDHAWGEWMSVREPTFLKEGERHRTCAHCGVTQSEPIARLAVPKGYKAAQYVEGNGNQCIFTGINIQDRVTADLTFAFTQFKANTVYHMLGARDTKTSPIMYAYLCTVNADKNWRGSLGGGSMVVFTDLPKAKAGVTNHTVSVVNGTELTFTVNGLSTNMTVKTATATRGRELGLMGYNDDGSILSKCYAKLFEAKVYTNLTVLARQYLPVYQVSSSTYGLWDTVSKSFKKSSGSAFLGELPPVVDPTIDGEPIEPGKVFEKATSAKPIVYPDTVTLTGEAGSQTVVFGDTATPVPAHYTATLGADGRTVTLALNANAVPQIQGDEETKPFIVGEGKVRLHIENAIPTLWYALGWGEVLGGAWNTNEYVKGAADFEDEPPAAATRRFYNVLTTDEPRSADCVSAPDLL